MLQLLSFRRLLSYLSPQTVATVEGRSGALSVTWENGRKVLNSPNGNQSFGALHRVWQAVFAHIRLRAKPPRNVLLLGLGGGSVPSILRDELHLAASITAVELDASMVRLARTEFALDRHAHVQVIVGDATVQVHILPDQYELILVDLFADLDLARGVESRAFINGLRQRCAHGGLVCFNTVAYDDESDARCQAVHDQAQKIFRYVDELQLEGLNRVFICS